MPTSLFKYMSPKRAIDFLTNLSIRFTRPLSFNDPFELNPCVFRHKNDSHKDKLLFNEMIKMGPVSLINFINDRVGVLSLSEDPESTLMWGHYAAGFTGAVIEFDAEHDFFSDKDSTPTEANILAKVSYSSSRPTLTAKFLKSLNFGENPSIWRSLLYQKQSLFLTKSVAWSYEKEWRCIRTLDINDEMDPKISNRHSDLMALYGFRGGHPVNDRTIAQELFTVPADAIKSVIIGPCARKSCSFGQINGFEEVVLEAILSKESMEHIAVNRAILDGENYSVRIVDMSNYQDIIENFSDLDIQDIPSREMIKDRIKSGIKGINPFEKKITSYS